jgi:hypothetical protein
MSYVIQNFYEPSIVLVFNQRLMLLIRVVNFTRLFTLFKLFVFFNKTGLSFNTTIDYTPIFFYHFFSEKNAFFSDLFELKTQTHLVTKLHKTLRLFALKAILKAFTKKKIPVHNIPFSESLQFNSYFFARRVILFPLKNSFYKPLFLFFLILSPLQ